MPPRSKKTATQTPVTTPWTEPPWLRLAVLGLAAILLLGLFSTQTDDPDLWWHLKTGQYIFQHHALPSPDPFSYTAHTGAPMYPGEEMVRQFNLTHEWLAQLLWYGTYSAGGFPALILLKALLLAATCGITGFLAARRSGSFYGGVAAALAVAPVAIWFAAERPALLTFFLTAVFILLLELRRGLWLLPLLSLLWANSHGGFFLGWIVLAAYIAASPRERRLWIVGGLSVALSFLNPNYWRIFEVLQLYRQSALTHALVEWRAPGLLQPPYMFGVLLVAAAAVLLLARRRVRLTDWILAIVFAAAALAAFRNIILFAFLAPILIAAYFPIKRSLPRFTGIAAAALLLAALGAGFARGQLFQLRAAEWKYPAGPAQFLIDHHITAPLFNTYESGGYLMWRLWPRQRVFIDGRALNESVYQDYRRILYNREAAPAPKPGANRHPESGDSGSPRLTALARYNVGAIIIDGFLYFSGREYPLAYWLMNPRNRDWKLVFQDPQWMLFLREPPAGVPVLPKPQALDRMESECLYHIERAPEECGCAKVLSQVFMKSMDLQSAQYMLGVYLAQPHPNDPEMEKLYTQLLRQVPRGRGPAQSRPSPPR